MCDANMSLHIIVFFPFMFWYIIVLPVILTGVFFNQYWIYNVTEQFQNWLLLEMLKCFSNYSEAGLLKMRNFRLYLKHFVIIIVMLLADVLVSLYCLVKYLHLDFNRFERNHNLSFHFSADYYFLLAKSLCMFLTLFSTEGAF